MKSLLVIADDQLVVRSVRFALRHAAGFRVVATVDGRASARPELSRLRPEIVLVNDMCQRTNVLARIRESGEEAPDALVVLLSGRMDAASSDDAFEAGAHVVIAQSMHPVALGTLLQELARGNVVQAPRVARAHTGAGGVRRLRPVAGHEASAARTSA